MRPRRDRTLLLGLLLLACPRISGGDEAKPREGADGAAAPRPAAAPVDPRFRSPRATTRTFLIAMNRTEDDPHDIEEAIACLDLSAMTPEQRHPGRFAFELEFILRSTNIPTYVIPDFVEGTECEVGEGKDIRLRLHRMPDGRWLFEGRTIQELPKMRLILWQQSLAAAQATPGQAKDADDVPSDFRSPYAMFRTYMDALKKGHLDRAADCLDLDDIPDPARRIVGKELAFKLKEVLDRNLLVIFQDLPDSSAGLPLEAVVHKEGRITAERKATGKRKGQWLFNRATVRSLDRLYDEFEAKPVVPDVAASGPAPAAPTFRRTPGLWLRNRLPGWARARACPPGPWSLDLYQLAGLPLLALLIVPVYRLAARPSYLVFRALANRRAVPADEAELQSRARPVGWLAVAWMLVRGVALLDLRMEPAGSLLALLVPAFAIAATLAAYQLIDPLLAAAAGPALARPGATTLATMAFPILALLLKILVAGAGLAALLDLFAFDVGTVLAGLGIGGLAFALAAQDTLKNFFGSLMLIADRTFRVGDLVQIGGHEGVVESVGLRTTRLRGLDDSLLTIPNSDLTTAHVTNFGARRCRRFQTHFTVPYGTPPDRIAEFRDGILGLIRQHPGVRQEKFEVALDNLGSSGIEILVRTFFDVSDGHAELAARDRLILEIVRLADRLAIPSK